MSVGTTVATRSSGHAVRPVVGAARRGAVGGWCALAHTAASLLAALQCSERALPLALPSLVRTAENEPPCWATRSWPSLSLVACAVRAAACIMLSGCGCRFLHDLPLERAAMACSCSVHDLRRTGRVHGQTRQKSGGFETVVTGAATMPPGERIIGLRTRSYLIPHPFQRL